MVVKSSNTPRVAVRVNSGQLGDMGGHESAAKSTPAPNAFPQDQLLDPKLVSFRAPRLAGDGKIRIARLEHRHPGQQFAVESHIYSCLFITTVLT